MRNYFDSKFEQLKKELPVENILNGYTDSEKKKKWKEEKNRISFQWQYINNLEDIQKYIDAYISTVNRYKNIEGMYDDAFYMYLALYKVYYAFSKMRSCYDNPRCNFMNINKEEIDSIFHNLYITIEEMKEINMRTAMKD